jgi:hypothetical protein
MWDLRPGLFPFHRSVPDPFEQAHGGPLYVVSATPWRWPWRFKLTQRIELTGSAKDTSAQATCQLDVGAAAKPGHLPKSEASRRFGASGYRRLR